jgi:hypothetical protein
LKRTQALSPEQQAILAVLAAPEISGRAGVTQSRHDELSQCLSRLDWRAFLRAADAAPQAYLHYALEHMGLLDGVPSAVREPLAAARRAAAARYLLRRRALRGAVAALHATAIDVIVLKGAAVAELVYPDPSLRSMQDVDLLVPADRLEDAAKCLLGAGLVYPAAPEEVSPWQPSAEFRVLTAGDYPVVMEIHGTLHSAACLPGGLPELWRRSRPLTAFDIAARSLEPHDLVLYLCLHLATHHLFERSLQWLLDVRLCLEYWRDVLDWERFARTARASGAAKSIATSFVVARDLLQARVPDYFFVALREDCVSREALVLAAEQIWESNSKPVPFAGLMNAAAEGSWRGGGRYIRQRVATWFSPRQTPGAMAPIGLGVASRRITSDLQLHWTAYRQRYRQGSLSPANLRNFVGQYRRRQRLSELLAIDPQPLTADK